MSGVVIFYTILIVTVFTRNIANAAAIQDVDIEKLLEILQEKQSNESDSSEEYNSAEVAETDTSQEVYKGRNNNADEENILNALKQLFNTNSNKLVPKSRQQKPSNQIRVLNYNSKNQDVAKLLNVLLSNDLKHEPVTQSRAVKKRLAPNRLLWNDQKNTSDLQDYSKIYILLTPKAIQKSRHNRGGVNDLISKILSLSASSSNGNVQAPQKQKRYKGFVVKELVQRRRGSREMYAPNDSGEEKPKRGRGGGGGGGHTAIPYIRHRGESIYEKDN